MRKEEEEEELHLWTVNSEVGLSSLKVTPQIGTSNPPTLSLRQASFTFCSVDLQGKHTQFQIHL